MLRLYILGFALALCGTLLGGCAAPITRVEPGAIPADFALAVVVYSPEHDATVVAAMPRPMRPARYILEPDRLLRASLGPGADVHLFPPPTRRLDGAQMQRLWEMAEQSGLLREGHPHRVPSEQGFASEFGRPIALITITRMGQRASAAIPLDAGDADAQAALLLVDHLAEWAWVRR
ncbi:MAG: hypothetical protein KF866_10615 [Phycisphaeraceae bacterium]|nr:hypothetical protein [Phycisphaeraceae bacterium]